MTDDLLQRLREAHPNSQQYANGSMILAEAADEIEGAELELAHQMNADFNRIRNQRTTIEQLQAETKTLRTRAESAERERDALAKRYADSESNLALCDAALQDVTRERDALREILRECEPIVTAHAKSLHMLDGFKPQEREYDDLAKRVRLVVEDEGQ